MKVVGVANTYPFHMLQRQSNWTVDYLNELELERIEELYSPEMSKEFIVRSRRFSASYYRIRRR